MFAVWIIVYSIVVVVLSSRLAGGYPRSAGLRCSAGRHVDYLLMLVFFFFFLPHLSNHHAKGITNTNEAVTNNTKMIKYVLGFFVGEGGGGGPLACGMPFSSVKCRKLVLSWGCVFGGPDGSESWVPSAVCV